MAERLAGKRIIHVNSTRVGGGVAEILGWMVPLMKELGLDARWEVITGSPEFYKVTKAFHNGLQGLRVTLKKHEFDLHTELNQENAQRLDLDADVVFVHDPQPIFLPRFTAPGRVGRWIWRCHIDASRRNRAVWKYLEGALPDYQAAVFSMAAFARPSTCPMLGDHRPAEVIERRIRADRHRSPLERKARNRRRLRRNHIAGSRLPYRLPGLFIRGGRLSNSLPASLRGKAATHGPSGLRIRSKALLVESPSPRLLDNAPFARTPRK